MKKNFAILVFLLLMSHFLWGQRKQYEIIIRGRGQVSKGDFYLSRVKDSSIILERFNPKTHQKGPYEIGYQDIRRIAIRERHKLRRGVIRGLLIGTSIGTALGFALGDSDCGSGFCLLELTAAQKALILGSTGFITGGMIGMAPGLVGMTFYIERDLGKFQAQREELKKYKR